MNVVKRILGIADKHQEMVVHTLSCYFIMTFVMAVQGRYEFVRDGYEVVWIAVAVVLGGILWGLAKCLYLKAEISVAGQVANLLGVGLALMLCYLWS